MRAKLFLISTIVMIAAAGAAWASAPIATPADGMPAFETSGPSMMDVMAEPVYGIESFPNGDLLDSIFAGADYLRTMQADITEDNAGNGAVDDVDPDDGGWNWRTTEFSHTSAASSTNLYGVTARGLFRAYQMDPRPEWFISLRDAADRMVEAGPEVIRSATDVSFLIDFASLVDPVDATAYLDGAQAIWDRQLGAYGAIDSLAMAIRDVRYGQGYANGIIPWDIGAWAESARKMDEAFPGVGHDLEADAVAEVLFQDSFNANPGYFDVYGRNQGNDPTWENNDYSWYSIGVAGLIQAFSAAGAHTDLLPGLQATLLECQYEDGAISDQYGAPADFNARDWQDTGYAMMFLWDYLPHTPEVLEALRLGGEWLASTQDVSGGFVYASSGNHYPEVGSECTAGMIASWLAAGSQIAVNLSEAGPINCGDAMTATFAFDREDGTAGLRGYEVTFTASAEVTFTAADIGDAGGLGGGFFQVIDNLDGTFTVTDAILGDTDGLLDDADLFTVVLTPAAEGEATVTVLDYKLRDPDNADITAELGGASFMIDCTAPAAVGDIIADPGHNKVKVHWTEAGDPDVVSVEIWRGMWYNNANGLSAYPLYDDLGTNVVPARPAVYGDLPPVDSGEWIRAGTVAPGVEEFVDTGMSERGVYWYEVVVIDEAGNPSLPADANDNATSYWLGDIANLDGDVDVDDITDLGATFGLVSTDVDYDFDADVGPTDDWSGYGIPATDLIIDFEDLMIFAMNYGVVTPTAKSPVGDSPLVLAWTRIDDLTWSLRLASPCPAFKGLRLRAALPADAEAFVTAGELADKQALPVFMKDIGRGGIDASLAIFGTARGFDGSGEVLRVATSAPVDLGDVEITARDLNNGKMTFSYEGEGGPALPRAFGLDQNVPNPFNPMTKIHFRLPEEQPVRLTVIALDGRRIATLIQRSMPAGAHEVTWSGRDDSGRPVASGTYFYRIDAGPYSQTRKMTMVR